MLQMRLFLVTVWDLYHRMWNDIRAGVLAAKGQRFLLFAYNACGSSSCSPLFFSSFLPTILNLVEEFPHIFVATSVSLSNAFSFPCLSCVDPLCSQSFSIPFHELQSMTRRAFVCPCLCFSKVLGAPPFVPSRFGPPFPMWPACRTGTHHGQRFSSVSQYPTRVRQYLLR